MAISFVAAAQDSSNSTNVTSITANRPSGVVEGDVMVASIQYGGGTGSPNPPSGWTLIHTYSGEVSVYYKVAGASEPSTYTFGSGTSPKALLILAWRGVLNSDPVNVSGTATGSGTSSASPSVNTTVAGCRVLTLHTNRASSTVSTPSGTTSRASLESQFHNFRAADFDQASAGATGSKTATLGTSRNWQATQIALEPANQAPNAPTLTAPIGGAVVDRTAAIDLQGTFSDPDVGDQLSEVTVEYRQISGSTTSVTQAASGTSFTVTITAGTLTAGNYEWRAKTKDADGVEGPFSSWAPFTAGSPPGDPVITAPVGTITDDPSLTEWTAPNQDALQVQTRSAASGGGTLHHDSGTVVSGTRAYSTPRPVTGRTEYTRVRVRFAGLWSPWTETSNAVAYTPPEIPEVNLVEDGASILVEVTNPTGTTDTVSNEIRRQQSTDQGTTWTDTVQGRPGTVDAYNTISRDVSTDGSFRDWQVGNRTLYRYAAVAVGDNGTKAVGAWNSGGGLAPSSSLAPSTLLAPSAT